MKIFVLCILCALLAFTQASYFEEENDEYARELAEEAANLEERDLAEEELTDDDLNRDARDWNSFKKKFQCKQRGVNCRGPIRCCGSLICNPATKTCMDCIPAGSRCNTFKKKCCGSTTCIKEKWYHFNGVCSTTTPAP